MKRLTCAAGAAAAALATPAFAHDIAEEHTHGLPMAALMIVGVAAALVGFALVQSRRRKNRK